LHNEISKSFKPIIGDIFLAKNGTTWVAAMLEIEKEFSIYVSLAYISPKRDLVNPLYFLYYINSRFAKIQFNKNLVWVGVPNLHLSKIRETKIPLPSLEVQLEIVDHIQSLNSKISYTKELSKSLKQEAKEEYENELFA
jgi:type I restriction enzyme S subunit